MDAIDFNSITQAIKDSFTSMPVLSEETMVVTPIDDQELGDYEPLICPVTQQDLDPDWATETS